MQTAILAIIVFGVLIFVHELGHFMVAKFVGIRVEEFSIGMGPKALSFKKGDTQYSIRLLPIGGYVKMAGETGFEENMLVSDDPSHFNNQSVLNRAGVILAGPIMNLLLAVLLFAMVFSFIGIPHIGTEITQVVPDSPAERAGLMAGDRIIAVDGQGVEEWGQLVSIIHSRPGESLDFTIIRDGQEQNIAITPRLDPETQVGMIGILQPEIEWQRANILQATAMGFQRTVEILVVTISALTQMITGQMGAEGVAGPVGIIQLIGESAQVGLIYLVKLTAVISINLGLLNLLPIPALDGSKLVFLAIEGIRGRPVDIKKENFVHLVGFALLMLLMLMITYRDIARFFG